MAFVFEYGKGRVFHTPLGHDVRAIEMPGVAELIRAVSLGRRPAAIADLGVGDTSFPPHHWRDIMILNGPLPRTLHVSGLLAVLCVANGTIALGAQPSPQSYLPRSGLAAAHCRRLGRSNHLDLR